MAEKNETVWQALAPYWLALVEFARHPDFAVLIRTPAFWGVSVVVVGLGLYWGWKHLLVFYLGALGLWGVAHYTLLQSVRGSWAYVMLAVLLLGMGSAYVLRRG